MARSSDALARRGTFAAIVTLLAVYTATLATGHGESRLSELLYQGLLVVASLVVGARAARMRADRTAWWLISGGLALSASADVLWTSWLQHLSEPPYPSLSDALWLAYYPLAYAGVLLLLRARVRTLPPGLWLDGAIAALGAAALVAAAVLEPVLAGAVEGAAAAVATNLAYPVGDLVLLAVVLWAFGCMGWRADRQWLLLGAGMVCTGAADTTYLAAVAHGSYVEGGMLDLMWPAGSLLIAWAAWQPSRPGATRVEGLRVFAVPAGFSLVGVGLLVADHVVRLNHLAVALSAATLVAAVARMGSAFQANLRMLRTSRVEAVTDALTELGNRRRLMEDLDAAMRSSELLALFDLDGFKRYNDTFGHPAGDALLKRLGSRLADAVAPHGRAYRMGGDEFCVLLGGPNTDVALTAAAAALCEVGQGFAIGASHGTVVPGRDATTAAEALQVADQRMYGHKASRAAGRASESRDVLMRVLAEREPDLHDHITSVAELAGAVGRRLGLQPEAIDELVRAAELHDVGKMAIPDTILNKPGPLDEDEWAFMRRHTLIGEAILSAAPALVPVARIVRASHERYDGGGYPDRLARDEIPVAARVVAICDAYDAMTSDRSYRRGMAPEAALEELRRGAGTQFDPEVVELFCAVLAERVSDVRAAETTSTG
jgi:two-component system, cell cycle response regulator